MIQLQIKGSIITTQKQISCNLENNKLRPKHMKLKLYVIKKYVHYTNLLFNVHASWMPFTGPSKN